MQVAFFIFCSKKNKYSLIYDFFFVPLRPKCIKNL